jgi:lysophospholipase L1-like esterase
MNWNKVKRNIKRALWCIAIAFVAGEVVVRIIEHFTGPTGSLYEQIVVDGKRFKMRPNTTTVVPERYGDIRYDINADGYRDRNHPESDDKKSIVWLGDSISFGLGVQDANIFVSQVERKIESRWPGKYSVMNLAMWAYNTDNEFDALREDGLKFRPKLVILQFYMNDFAMLPITQKNLTVGQKLTAIKNRVLYASALYRRVNQLIEGTQYWLVHDIKRERFPNSLNNAEPKGDTEYLSSHPNDDSVEAFQKIKEIAKLSRDQGAAFLLFISPDETQLFTKDYDLINERLGRFCEREGLQYCDPLEGLRTSPQKVKLYHDGVHFSTIGHTIVADMIFDDIVKKGMLEKVQ